MKTKTWWLCVLLALGLGCDRRGSRGATGVATVAQQTTSTQTPVVALGGPALTPTSIQTPVVAPPKDVGVAASGSVVAAAGSGAGPSNAATAPVAAGNVPLATAPLTTTGNAASEPQGGAGVALGANGVTAGSAPLQLPKTPDLPAPVNEVLRLSETALSDDVLTGYISNIKEPYSLDADQIIYLRDLGLSMEVIESLLKQSATLSPATAVTPAQPATPPAGAPQGPAAGVAPAPGGANLAPSSAPVVTEVPGAPVNYVSAPTAQQPVTVVQPTTVVQQTYFYEALAPYGTWVSVDGYGWCWQPSVVYVEPGWRPYCSNGSWVWTDAGWYWNSYYSWGWAPFHYGRWHHHSHRGWVWVPGNVWGPGWVTWRYNAGYCGWAPLPPSAGWSVGIGFTHYGSSVSLGFGWGLSDFHYAFVPFNRFCDPRPWRHTVGRDRAPHVYKDSVVSNGQGNVIVNGNNNHVVINNGVTPDHVRKYARQEVHKASLQDQGAPPTSVRAPSATERPTTLAVYRPNLPAQADRPPRTVLDRQESRKSSVSTDLAPTVIPGRAAMARPYVPGSGGVAAPAAGIVSGAGGSGSTRPVEGSRPAVGRPSANGSGVGGMGGRVVESGGGRPAVNRGSGFTESPTAGGSARPGVSGGGGTGVRSAPSRVEPGASQSTTSGRPVVAPGRTGVWQSGEYPGARSSARPEVSGAGGSGSAVQGTPSPRPGANYAPSARSEPPKSEAPRSVGRPAPEVRSAPSAPQGSPNASPRPGGSGRPEGVSRPSVSEPSAGARPMFSAPAAPARSYQPSAPARGSEPAPSVRGAAPSGSSGGYTPTVVNPGRPSYAAPSAPAPIRVEQPRPQVSQPPASAPAPQSAPARPQPGPGNRARDNN